MLYCSPATAVNRLSDVTGTCHGYGCGSLMHGNSKRRRQKPVEEGVADRVKVGLSRLNRRRGKFRRRLARGILAVLILGVVAVALLILVSHYELATAGQ